MILQTIATQAAMISGFTFNSLAQKVEENHPVLGVCYLISAVLSMGCGLLAVIISTFSTMFGPGLALRGPSGSSSMHKAVDELQKESRICFQFFMVSLVFFHISSFFVVWLFHSYTASLLTNIVLFVFLILFFVNGYRIFKKLHISQQEAITGKFQSFQQYEHMPDLDRRQIPQGQAMYGQQQNFQNPNQYQQFDMSHEQSNPAYPGISQTQVRQQQQNQQVGKEKQKKWWDFL